MSDPAPSKLPPTDPIVSDEPPSPEDSAQPAGHSTPADADDTVGTGSAIAIGCIAATLVLIVLGLLLIAVIAILG